MVDIEDAVTILPTDPGDETTFIRAVSGIGIDEDPGTILYFGVFDFFD